MQEGAQFGPYTLLKRIAFGGMAEIHLAKTSGIGGFEKLLALKVIHPKYSEDQEFIDMLVDEAKIAVQLSHVNICQVFDLGRIDGTYYIALEFIDGKDLYQLLVKCSEKDIPIPLDLVAFIGMEMAAGLQYAHTKSDNYGQPLSLVHRDVSPQNVLVSYDGEVKIVDFGIAKAAKRSRETESGVIKGKFFYMSPEQAWGDPIDGRTDIFSAGICLYEMLVGEMLYHEEKALLLLDKVRKAEIPNMRVRRRDLPQALEHIVLKALTRDRDQRFQSAGALQAALSGFLYGNWPNFNRTRLKEFMQYVFGDQRFVLARPVAPVPKAKPNVSGSLMGASDFDPTTGHSVLFDLNKMEVRLDETVPPVSAPVVPQRPAQVGGRPTAPARPVVAPPKPAPDASFEDPEPTSALLGDSMDRSGLSALGSLESSRDDDEQEHTMMESVWSSATAGQDEDDDDDGDRTAILGPEVAAAVESAMAAHGKDRADEPPTGLFNRHGEAPQGRVNRPVARPEDSLSSTFDSSSGDDATMSLPPAEETPVEARRPSPAAPQRPAPPRVAPSPPAPPTPPRPPSVASVPPRPAPSVPPPVAPPARPPAVAPAPTPALPAAQTPAPARPRAPSNRVGESGKPTMAAMPPPRLSSAGARSRWVAALATPRGITIVALVLLLCVALWQLAPMFLGPPKARTVALVVNSTPAGASIFLDGQDTGLKSPSRLENLAVGAAHTLRLALPGHEDQEEHFTITPAEVPPEGELRRRLFLEKKKGRLEITSLPDKADVFIEGRFACETPCVVPDLDREKSEVKLLLRKNDFRDYSDVIRWGDETAVKVEYKLTPRTN